MEGLRGSGNDSSRWKANMEAGIISRAIHHVFESLEKTGNEYFVRVSHLELYNENLSDLLNPSNTNLRLYKDEKNRVFVHNLEEVRVNSPQDIFNILEKSWEERKTAETDLNAHSSRSHCIFTITIQIKETTIEGEDFIKVGKLNFVDLAGSENIGRSGADKVYSRKQEAGNINKSLLTLGRVITALTENSPHIPYRESKLTHLLQDSLGGKTKTCIIATISPSSGNFEETMSTLDYAQRAKNIKNKPEVNQKLAQKEVIKEYTEEIANLQKQLDCLKRKDGIYIPQESYNEMQENMNKAKEEIKFLEERIADKERQLNELLEELDKQNRLLNEKEKHLKDASESLDKKQIELMMAKNELSEKIEDLNEHKVLLDEHRATEEKFQNEANIVLNTLSTTIGDINGLFNKISRKENLESTNMDLAESFREELIRKMNETENKLNRFIQASSQNHKNMQSDINAFMDEKLKDISSLESKVKSLEEGIDEHCDEIEKMNQRSTESFVKLFDDIKSSQITYERENSEVRNQFMKDSHHVIERLRNLMSEHNEKTSNWVTENKSNIQRTLDKLDKFTNTQKEKLSESKTNVNRFITSHTGQLTSHRQILDNFLKQQKEQMALFKESTLSMLKEVLDQQLNEQMKKTVTSIQQIQEALKLTSKETSEFNKQFGDSCESISSDLLSFVDEYNNEHSHVMRSIQSFSENESEYLTQNEQTILNYNEMLDNYKSKTENTLKQYRNEFEEYCEKGNELVEESMRLYHDRVEELSKYNSDNRRLISNDLLKHSESIEMYMNDLVKGIETTSKNTNDFISSTIKYNQNTKDKVKSFSLHNYIPTGETPIKRTFEYPMKFSKTRSHEEVLREYRMKKEALKEITNF